MLRDIVDELRDISMDIATLHIPEDRRGTVADFSNWNKGLTHTI